MSTKGCKINSKLSKLARGMSIKLEKTSKLLSVESRSSTSQPSTKSVKETNKLFRSSKHLRTMPFLDLVKRLKVCGKMPEEVFVTSLVLFNRSLEKGDFEDEGCVHKLFIAVIFLSFKLIIDSEHWFLDEFSKLSLVRKTELEKMEICLFTQILDYKVSVTETEFLKAKRCLEVYCRLNQQN